MTEQQIRRLFSRYDFCLSSVEALQDEIKNLEAELQILMDLGGARLGSPNVDGMPRGGGTSDPTASNAFGGRDVRHVQSILAEKRAEVAGYLESVSTVKKWLAEMPPIYRSAVEAHFIRGFSLAETRDHILVKHRRHYSASGIKRMLRCAVDEIMERSEKK